MEIPKSKLKEIAEELDAGCDCYFNLKTFEIIAIPYFSGVYDEDEFQEMFQTELEKLEKQKKNLLKLEILEGKETFKIMERFADQVPSKSLKLELEEALLNRKPFQHFKYAIDHSDYRKEWFVFKQNAIESLVERQLNVGLNNN